MRERKRTLNSAIPETRVQVVGDFVKERGRDLFARVVEEVDLNGPRSKGEAFDAGVLGSAIVRRLDDAVVGWVG